MLHFLSELEYAYNGFAAFDSITRRISEVVFGYRPAVGLSRLVTSRPRGFGP
jgi:hypothetical protein